MSFVEYHFVTQPPLPPYRSALYDYLVGANGVFLRSRREGLEVVLPVAPAEIRGLVPVEPTVVFTYPRVPAALVQYILDQALAAHDSQGRSVEMLFHLTFRRDHWILSIPEQIQTAASVTLLDDGPSSSHATALIEVHSHHDMHAFFSHTDDRDERIGFRINAVLGRIFTRPEVLVRVNCEGIHQILPATHVFDLPETIIDASLTWTDEGEEEPDTALQKNLLQSHAEEGEKHE